MEIITVQTPSLGDRSYVVIDGAAAAVIDPQRDIERIETLLAAKRLRLTHVFETHLHNDYVTGGLELARRTGAVYVLSADDEVAYDRTGARDGDEFAIGDEVTVRAVHTPGHTPTHLSYVALERGAPAAVFTGGSMLYGTVGRTDLISEERTDELSRSQFHSVRRLAEELPDHVGVHPTHGFGSFCSSASTSGSDTSTVGQERLANLALTVDDEDTFVRRLLGGLTAYPRYYAQMAPRNRQGASPIDLSPPEPVDAGEIRRRIHAGAWVVDLRSRTAFARGHLAGTINLEVGDSFVTYLGWTLRWGTPVTLVGDTAAEVAEAQVQMARIGIDRPAGAADGGLDVWAAGGDVRSYRTATFADLADAKAQGAVAVVDVRRDDEWAEGRIAGAVHIPLHDIEARMDEVPAGEVWVHCASGYRAALAASLLDRAGRTVVAVDDEWAAAAKHAVLGVHGS
jgi:glyoxylase-like metal-dependent hydrolase (beta-lactamase superfamily II)/rhodanese-related sulfurtransferase